MERGRTVRRAAEFCGWIGVGGVGVVMLTQAAGWNGTELVAVTQSLTPYGILLVLAIAVVAVWQRSNALATVGALVGAGAFVLSFPLVVAPTQTSARADAIGLDIASINLLYSNPVVDEVADDLLALDPDVIVFTEYTTAHGDALVRHPLSEQYPYRIDRGGGLRSSGTAVWSKFPSTENEPLDTVSTSIDASIDGLDGPLRLLAVHPPTPVFDFSGWQGDLRAFGAWADEVTEPAVIAGDFNSSYWHPLFRDLLQHGLLDAHMVAGAGWSTSWPTDGFVPPFVRLDHALTGNGLVSTGVEDFRVPGSDHIAFVVTVKPSG